MQSMFFKVADYLKSSRAELKYVNWPTRKATIKFTALVIIMSAAITVFLGLLDFLFSYILTKFLL